VPVEKEYSFEIDDGTKSLADLFDGRSQLLIYHFMFGPEYEAGCPVCSSIADNLDPNEIHLAARDVKPRWSSLDERSVRFFSARAVEGGFGRLGRLVAAAAALGAAPCWRAPRRSCRQGR
jgi:hypothetical protein